MPRGGARANAGRKPLQPEPLQPLPSSFDLIEDLRAIPATPQGRDRRAAMALAASGATDDVIAATICSDLAKVASDIVRGRLILEASIRAELMAHATAARGRRWSISAAKWALRELDPTAPRRRPGRPAI